MAAVEVERMVVGNCEHLPAAVGERPFSVLSVPNFVDFAILDSPSGFGSVGDRHIYPARSVRCLVMSQHRGRSRRPRRRAVCGTLFGKLSECACRRSSW